MHDIEVIKKINKIYKYSIQTLNTYASYSSFVVVVMMKHTKQFLNILIDNNAVLLFVLTVCF